MAHNRAQLNALIFDNPVVLPRTSPGFAEMTIAVAELQGGNNAKAALYGEAAVIKDQSLAAGWLAKMAADVFEATPNELYQQRALRCMDFALECAPTCRKEIIEFFVSNILAHYVEVLCGGALEEASHWIERENYAREFEQRASSLDWQAAQLNGSAAMLGAAGLVTGVVALFSRRLGTRVFSGVASVAAFSEAARLNSNALVLEGMAAELRMAEYAQRLEGTGHRDASLRYLVPARDLIGAAARLLHAVGLPPQSLDRLIYSFTDGFRQVLHTHLWQLSREIGPAMSMAIEGDPPSPAAISWQGSASVPAVHPSGYLLPWLERMLPGVRGVEAYELLANPMPTIAWWIYGFREGTRSKLLLDRMQHSDRTNKNSRGCLGLLTLVCLFLPPLALLPGGLLIWYGVVARRRARARERVRAIFNTLWSVDAWLQMRRSAVASVATTVSVLQLRPPPLPVGAQGGGAAKRPGLSPFLIGLIVFGAFLFLLIAVGAFLGPPARPQTPARNPASAEAPVATNGNASTKTTPEIRRAVPVRNSAAPSPFAPSMSEGTEASYFVVGVPTGDTLNVRSGPGANNSVVARLPNGTTHIGVTGTPVMNGTTEWVPIRVGERTGWVTKQHLARD